MAAVTAALDGYEPFPAATAIAELVDDISNWYVRRSRRRFWRTDPDADPADSLGAQATLHEVLVTRGPPAGPDVPVPGRPDVARPDRCRPTTTRCTWPTGRRPTRRRSTRRSRRGWPWPAVSPPWAGRPGPRPGSRCASRWPGPWSTCRRAARPRRAGWSRTSSTWTWWRPPTSWATSSTYELVPNFKLLGPRLGPRVQQLRAAMGSVDGAAAAADLAAGRPVAVELADGPVELTGDEVELRVRAQPGFAVSRDGAEVVALDLTLDDDLRRRGLAREVIRHVQELRKAAGSRSPTGSTSTWSDSTTSARCSTLIGREVLARSWRPPTPEAGAGPGTTVRARRRAAARRPRSG